MAQPSAQEGSYEAAGVPAWASVALLGGLLGLVGVAALAIGGVSVLERTIAILLHQLHLTEEVTWTPMQATIILQVRFPRVLMAALVGGLALSGAVMQDLSKPHGRSRAPRSVQRGRPGAVLALHLGLAMQHYLMLGLPFWAGWRPPAWSMVWRPRAARPRMQPCS